MRHPAQTLRRQNISGELANVIREMVVDGALPAGSRINEVHLARDLGVSRTPLREAIAGLVREDTLVTVPRIGAFVKPLTIEEFEQIYSVRTLLDPEALRLAGLPSHRQLERLKRLNARIQSVEDADKAIDLDDEWHLLLLDRCPNKVLLDLIGDFMRRTRRYELALFRDLHNIAVATDTHEQITDALERGDLDAACSFLRTNMENGSEPIRSWLREREMQLEPAK
jgi:DNA-binding GntR family transcriptional regulator